MFDFTNFFSGFMKPGGKSKSSTSGMGFMTELFKSFGNPGAQTDEDSGSSSSIFKGMMSNGPFGNIGAMFNMVLGGFLSPFAQMFGQLTESFQAPEARKEFRAYGADIDFNEELLSEVPEGLREPFLAVHAQLKAKDKQRIDGEVEVLLGNKTLSAFEKRARFRQLMVSDVANCDGISPDAAEALETACMEDFGVNKDEDVDALASNLVELSKIRAQGKESMSPLAKVQAGNYDKTIARFERAISEHEVKVSRIKDDIIAKMIAENPPIRFEGENRAELEEYAEDWVKHSLGEGDPPHVLDRCDFCFNGLEEIDRTLRGEGKGLGLFYLGDSLARMQMQLREYNDSRDRSAEFMSDEQQRRQGLIHARIRHAKVQRAYKSIEGECGILNRERDDIRARIYALDYDEGEESDRYRDSYAVKLADIEAKIEFKQRHMALLEEHLNRLVGEDGIETELAYQQEKQRFEDDEEARISARRHEIEEQGGDPAQVVDLREVIREGAKRGEAMAILDGARGLDKAVGTADRISAKDMMVRLGRLEEGLSHARKLSTKREELRVLIRRMQHKLDSTGGMAVDVREDLTAKIAAAKKELRKEEERLSKFQAETRGASHVFESMRKKDRVVREAIDGKKVQAREVFLALDAKVEDIDRMLAERGEDLLRSGFDPKGYCQHEYKRLKEIYSNDGNGVQRGTLIDVMRLFQDKERAEKEGASVLEREIQDRGTRARALMQEITRRRDAGVDLGRLELQHRELETEIHERQDAMQRLHYETEEARNVYKEQVALYKKLNPLAQAYNARLQVLDSYDRERAEIDDKRRIIGEIIDELEDGDARVQAGRLNVLGRELRELKPKLEKYRLTCEDFMDKDTSLLQAQLKAQGTGAMSMDDILAVPERDAPARRAVPR